MTKRAASGEVVGGGACRCRDTDAVGEHRGEVLVVAEDFAIGQG